VNRSAGSNRGSIWKVLGCALAGLVLVLSTGALSAQAAGSKKKKRRPKPKPADTGGETSGRSGGNEPYEGYGVNRGGRGGRTISVSSGSQLVSALKQSNCVINVRGDIRMSGDVRSKASNITLDGGGRATIWGRPGSHSARMLEFYGSNLIIQNIRIRNSGDNLGFKAPANKIMIHHVTTSGADDDGMSIAYGTKNVTIQYSAFFGCTRSCFIKYKNPANVSFHHNFIRCQWIRGPLISGATNIDVRNIVNEDWTMWGTRFEAGSTGNGINNTFVLTGATGGKPHGALYTAGAGKHCFRGNVGKGRSQTPKNEGSEIPCARVTTHSAAESERIVRARAGCMPRDSIDRAYIAAKKWRVGKSTPFIIKAGL